MGRQVCLTMPSGEADGGQTVRIIVIPINSNMS
jgi:hypothetical protein